MIMFKKIHKYVSSSIVHKTAILIAIVFLIAMLLLSIVITGLHTHQLQERIIADKEELTIEVAKGVDTLFDNMSMPLVSLSNQYSVGRLLSREIEPYKGEWMNQIRDIETSLAKMHIYYDYVVDLVIIDQASTIHFSLTNRLSRNYDYLHSDWFREAVERPGAIKYAPPHGNDYYVQDYTNPNVFSIIYPVTRSGVVRGYILCEVDATRISYLFHDTSPNYQEGYLLVDEHGRSIYDYVRSRSEGSLEGIVQRMATAKEDGIVEIQEAGNFYTGRRLDSTGWYIISETDVEIIRDSVRAIVLIVVLIVIAAILICVLVMRHIMSRLQRPINSMVERISSYDGTGPVEFSEQDSEFREFAVVRMKFEEMAAKIEALINDVYLAQVHKRDMEFEMLVNQVNPHFLYNVLQTIHGEAVLSDNRQIEDMISSLSQMLRYTIDYSSDMSTIEQELQYLRHYLGFYLRRFPHLFSYSIKCDPGLEQKRVLKYVLQPVVENSIKHGFKNIKEGGILKIHVWRMDNSIYFEIWDNGYGVSPERLEEVRENMHLALRGSGVGIANTDARIKLMYGQQYGIELDSELGSFTRTLITIPDVDCIENQALTDKEDMLHV